MDGIMHGAIHQVAEYKTREESKSILSHQQKHQCKNNRGNDETWNRRHEEACFISGVMMVVAMHHVNKSSCLFAFCNHMKGPAVHDIFKKSPEKHACQKQTCDSQGIEFKTSSCIVTKTNDHRQINPPNYQWMGFG